ncbi:PLP-dependent aminotransferase family protein [Pseudomonas sp. P39-UII1]|uniref:PLP-dependent aminotransferase family protein n=1 Tax=Pseudomonas sp. P39-UII1 TaxID=3080333 RepID=UPI003209B718
MRREFAYQTVYRYLETLIDETARGGQRRLPSLRALSRRLRVSLATVQAAYGLLEHEGRVLSVPKSGYFVQADGKAGAPLTPPSHAAAPAHPTMERLLFAHERRLARQGARASPVAQGVGEIRLRHVLAERYTRSSRQSWHAEDVHLGPDLQALLETLLAGLALQGSTVLVASPCCWRVLRVLQRVGMQVLEVPLDNHGGPDLRRLACLLGRESVRMMIMPSCLSMPMGRLMSPQDQREIAHLLARHPVWLLENDVDSEHCFAAPPGCRLRDWVDPRCLLVLGSLEALVGVEAPYAYVLSRHCALAEVFALRAFQLPPVRQQALAQMLGKGEVDEQLGRRRVELRLRMEQVCQHLEACLGGQVAYEMPDGGHVLWLQLLQPMPSDRVVAGLSGPALHVLAGSQFSVQGRYQHYLALAWTAGPPEALREAIFRLSQALELRCGRQVGSEA